MRSANVPKFAHFSDGRTRRLHKRKRKPSIRSFQSEGVTHCVSVKAR